MNTLELGSFLPQITVCLCAAMMGGITFSRLGFPFVIGEIAAGVILGPTILSTIFPSIHEALFSSTEGLNYLVNIGMVFFMLAAGVEIDFKYFRVTTTKAIVVSASGMLFPLLLGVGLYFAMPVFGGLIFFPRPLESALFLGIALSISALPVIIRILADLKILHTETGAIIISAAIISDLVGWTLFTFMTGFLRVGGAPHSLIQSFAEIGVFTGIVLLFGLFVKIAVKRYGHRIGFSKHYISGFIICSVLCFSILAQSMGIHYYFGAFIAGIILRKALDGHVEIDWSTFSRFTMIVFAPLYFVSVGLKINFITNFEIGIVIAVLVAAFIGKAGGAYLGGLLSGLKSNNSVFVGLGLNSRGAMEVVLANAAYKIGIINEQLLVALIFMAIFTTAFSGFCLKQLSKRNYQLSHVQVTS